MSHHPAPYNPLDIDNLAENVGLALEAQPLIRLSELETFYGVGLYALYYSGDHPLYRPLIDWNGTDLRMPIYVGRAVSKGLRKGAGFGADPKSKVLYKRLDEHRGSIAEAGNLDVGHFWVRYLVTLAVWIPLGEASIIHRYQPVWNVVVDGFGNHDPGAGRRSGERPKWDVIHPGRWWAELQAPNRASEAEIAAAIHQHFGPLLSDRE